MIKSNPIPGRWATHDLENNNTKDVLPLLWRFLASCQASQPGDLAKRLGIHRESDFEGQWDLIIGLSQDWGRQRLHFWRAQKMSVCTKTQGKGVQWPYRRLNQTYLLELECLQHQHTQHTHTHTHTHTHRVDVWVRSDSLWRHRPWQQQSWKGPLA